MCFIQMCIGMLPRSDSRCRTIATFVLFFANVVFLFAGLTLVGLGLIFLLLQGTVLSMLPFHATINLLAAPVITIGALAYVIAVLGFCSAWKQWRSLLIPYVIFVALLLIAKGCVVVVTWGTMDRLEIITHQWLIEAFHDPAHRDTFHLLEMSVQCCGTEGFFSYHDLGLSIPHTCCDMPAFAEIGDTCDPHHAYGGCADIISDNLHVLAEIADATLFYVIAVEILALISSVYLLRTTTVKPQLVYTIVPNNNHDQDNMYMEMAQMLDVESVTSQPGPQAVYEACEMPV